MEIDVTKCEYYAISDGCMSNEKECWSECCSKNNNCKFKQLERYKQAIEEIFFCLIKENRKGTIKDTIITGNVCVAFGTVLKNEIYGTATINYRSL